MQFTLRRLRGDAVKILAWNIHHETNLMADKGRNTQIRIPPDLPAALVSLDPDVIILNAYVERPDPKGHNYLLECLKKAEFRFTKMSEKQSWPPRHNRVFIASRTPIELRHPLADDARTLHVGSNNLHIHAASNHLHVYLPKYDLSIIGLRVPDLNSDERDAYWGWLRSEANKLLGERIIMIGDFNADAFKNSHNPNSKHLASLITRDGWLTKNPTDNPWSRISQTSNGHASSRIDHVLSSPSVTIDTAKYIANHQVYTFTGPTTKEWSDHAVLSVEVNCPELPLKVEEAVDGVVALA